MTDLLPILLWLFIGVSTSVAWTFACIFPTWGAIKLIDVSGQRRNIPAERRRRSAVVAISTLLPLLLASLWYATVWVGNWLNLNHTTALQVGVLIGGCGMGSMLWIFIAASLDQTIKDRPQ